MIPVIETPALTLLFVAVLSYGLGSIPFGVVVSRAMGLGDVRAIGSGNIGATNVLRTGSKPAAFLTLAFDAGKGAFAVLVSAKMLGPDAAQVAGLAAFVGHIFPVWLRFRGGKGMATFLGVVLALSFWAGLAACATWLVFALIFRISSLAALAATVLVPVWLFVLDLHQLIGLAAVLALLVILRHKDNISRLFAGTEPKIGTGKQLKERQ